MPSHAIVSPVERERGGGGEERDGGQSREKTDGIVAGCGGDGRAGGRYY